MMMMLLQQHACAGHIKYPDKGLCRHWQSNKMRANVETQAMPAQRHQVCFERNIGNDGTMHTCYTDPKHPSLCIDEQGCLFIHSLLLSVAAKQIVTTLIQTLYA